MHKNHLHLFTKINIKCNIEVKKGGNKKDACFVLAKNLDESKIKTKRADSIEAFYKQYKSFIRIKYKKNN